MNYHLIRNARRGLRLPPGLLIPILIMVSAFLLQEVFPDALSSAAHGIAAPVLRVGLFLENSLESAKHYISSKQLLLREIRGLREELTRYELLLTDRRALLEENRALKTINAAGSRTIEARVRAAVLATPPQSAYDTLILDAGEQDDISPGDEVRSGAVALGRIRVALRETSVAELFSAPGNATAVVILHEGVPVPVSAVGEGAGAFRATLPRAVPVSVGDPVVLPSREDAVVFGAVAEILGNETSSFSTIYIKPPVSLWSLLFVDIVQTPVSKVP